MARLVVYGSSIPCPDMARFQWWLAQHEVEGGLVAIDIHHDEDAYRRVIGWTGHASVPTLVIAEDDGLEPLAPPEPLAGRRARAFDRGTVPTEPNPGQIEPFLARHGIVVRPRA